MLIITRELEQQYNRAKFFTLVLHPLEQSHSAINFLNLASVEGALKKHLGLVPMTYGKQQLAP